MKVCLDGRPTLGGIHRYTRELCRVLPASLGQVQFHIFGQQPGLGRRVGPAGTGRPWPVISGLRQILNDQLLLPQAAWRASAEIFHAPQAFRPERLGVHTVVTCHDLWLIEGFATKPQGWKKYYDRRNFLRALAQADHLITLSHAVADKLTTFYGLDAQRITRIPPPLVPLDPVPVSGVTLPSKRFLLTVGTLEPRKNLERLLRAQAKAFSRTRVPLYLVGPYGWRAKEILITLARLGPAARWLGQVDDGILACLYQQAAAVVQYSLDEGFDYPVAEALSFGQPVVLSDIPVHREFAGKLGLYASPFDPASLARRLEEVLEWSMPRLAEHAAEARTLIEQIRWEGRAERYLEVYRKVLAQPNRTVHGRSGGAW